MFRCPFRPCMNCPYSTGYDMNSTNQAPGFQGTSQNPSAANIPPPIEVQDINQMRDNQSIPNMQSAQNMPPMVQGENMENRHPAQAAEQMKSTDNSIPNIPDPDKKEAFVRVLHASPDAPAVDVFIDGSKAIDDLAYGMLAGYMPIFSGKHKIEVFPGNKTKNPIISATVSFAGDTFSTFAIVGKMTNIEPLIIDDYEDKVPRNQALVKFVHMSPNAPTVDITLPDGKKLFTNISFKQTSDYIMLAPGEYSLQVRLAGTNNIVLNVPEVSIQGGIPYSLYAIGLAGGMPPLTVVLVEDEL